MERKSGCLPFKRAVAISTASVRSPGTSSTWLAYKRSGVRACVSVLDPATTARLSEASHEAVVPDSSCTIRLALMK